MPHLAQLLHFVVGSTADPNERKRMEVSGSTASSEATMAGVLNQFGSQYRGEFSERMPRVQLAAMDAMAICRTAQAGGHILKCNECGGRIDYAYHSCGHRACPKCSYQQGQRWLESRRRELLPVPYFHVVFTVPQELRRLIRTHQRKLYAVFFRAASEALMELAADPKYVGGRIAMMCVLHTWTRTLEYHPHLHCMVPAGGVDDQDEWRSIDRSWLFPQRALGRLFRGKFAALAREAVPNIVLPQSIFDTEWVIHIDPARHGSETVLSYLARYVHRVALSDSRIRAVTDEQVVFRYKDRERRKWRTMRLGGKEFLRRFLQHVLAKGFHKVRYYGLWSPSHQKTLLGIREKLLAAAGLGPDPPAPSPSSEGERAQKPEPPRWRLCPICRTGIREILARFKPTPRNAWPVLCFPP